MFLLIPPEFWAVCFFILGLILGSFFNVCIWRIPRDQSIVKPPSHCPACNRDIKWYDNIPLVSYIILRGKCRACGERISIRYPAIELASGILIAYTYWHFGFSPFLPFALIYISFMIIMFVIDLEHFILPDRFTLTLIPIGFISSFFREDFSWKDSLLGMLAGGGLIALFSIFYYLYKRKVGMGGGDIKLMAAVGAYLGAKLALLSIVIGSVGGVLVMLPIMAIRKKKMDTMLPFGPFLTIAAVICLFWGEEIFTWWMEHPIIDLSVD